MSAITLRVGLLFERPYVDAHPCFREMAAQFARRGCRVDLFMPHESTHPLPDFSPLDVRIVPLTKSRAGLFDLLRRLSVPGRYDVAVATPQWALYWAIRARALGRYRVVCLSDEIYPWNEVVTPSQKKWKRRESAAHRAADVTVSLSEARMRMVAAENGLAADHAYVVIPNAPAGAACRPRSTYYRDRFSIALDRGILLHAGTLNWRLAGELATVAATWNEPWDVVFQGRFTGALTQASVGRALHYEDRVFPAGEMRQIASSADMGLALYDRDDPLERRNGETPGKLGLYLSCALPVICGNLDSLRWVATERCGEWISDISQIPAAAARIKANYAEYSFNAGAVFNRRFEYGNRFEAFWTALATGGRAA